MVLQKGQEQGVTSSVPLKLDNKGTLQKYEKRVGFGMVWLMMHFCGSAEKLKLGSISRSSMGSAVISSLGQEINSLKLHRSRIIRFWLIKASPMMLTELLWEQSSIRNGIFKVLGPLEEWSVTGRIVPFFRNGRLDPLCALRLMLCWNVGNDRLVSSHIKSNKDPFIRLKRLPLLRRKETLVSMMVVHRPGRLSKGVSGIRVAD